MKITGVNLDCLQSILEYLNFDDLFNVALSNKRLNEAAALVFNRKCQQKSIIIGEIRILQYRLFKMRSSLIEVFDLKTCLQFLRCFGNTINTINYWAMKYHKQILSYINEYCSESLSKLTLERIDYGHLNVFLKSFTRVEQLIIDNCYVDVRNDWFKNIFPKMESLKINFGHDFHSSENAYFAHQMHIFHI